MSRTAMLLLFGLALLAAKPITAAISSSNASPLLVDLANPIDLDDDANPTFAPPQPMNLAKQSEHPEPKKPEAKPTVSGAPTAVSGAPTKKHPLKELVDKKTEELKNLLGKKKEKPSLPPLPQLPKKDLSQLLKKSKASPPAPATQVSGAPVTDQKKDLQIPVKTIDLKKVIGRKM